MNDKANELLKQGQQLRENGQTFEALDAINRSLDFFSYVQDYSGFAHAILDRAICWQHLYQFHNNDYGFAVLYKKDAESMLEIVEAKNITTQEAGAYFINAKAMMLFDNYDQAIENFNLSIAKMTTDRNAQKGDWQTNLGKAMYLKGKKQEGVQLILEGIERVKKYSDEIDQYTANVWISGGYIRLAEVLQKDNAKLSEDYLQKAKVIIEADPRQIVRKKQIENYLKTQKTGI